MIVRSALLLAAGLGRRLRPLTDVLPKCLAPIRGRPLLEYWLQCLIGAGVDRILVNTHHHADLVKYYIARSPWAARVTLVHEPRLLGTGGTLVANIDFLRGGPFMVAHADNLSLFDAREFVVAHEARPRTAALTMMTFTTDAPETCGIVTTDSQGLVDGFFEKVATPRGNRANAAVYIMQQEVLDVAAALSKPVVDISTELLPRFLGRMWTWHNAVYHRDIGTLASWRAAQRDYLAMPPPPPAPDPWLSLLEAEARDAGSVVARLLAQA
jgi:mannose-1-phosphate guanylyltransferase